MKKKIESAVLAIVAMASSAAFSAGDESPFSDHRLQKALNFGPAPLKALLAAHERLYPGSMSHNSIIYMPFLDRTVYLQELLIQRLRNLPDYQKDMEARGPLLDFTIRATKDYTFEARVFDPYYLNQFQDRLNGHVSHLRPESVFDAITATLVTKFPATAKRYKRSRGRYWWTWDDRDFEEAIVAAVMLSGLTRFGEDLTPLKEKIRFEEGHIDYLADKAVWGPVVDQLEKLVAKKHRSVFRPMAEEVIEKWLGRLRGGDGEARVQEVKAGDTLHVQEVHPDLAILRGFVGNDCATDVSFGFPYSPFERVYYATDADGTFLGYINLSVVEFRGKRTLYYHTNAGPKVTHAVAEMLMRGFFAAREQIGATYMVLPEDHRIDANNNYHPVRDVLMKSVRGVPFEPVTWIDGQYRDVIFNTGSSRTYDDPETNRIARVLEVNADDLELTFTERAFEPPLPKAGCADQIVSEGQN